MEISDLLSSLSDSDIEQLKQTAASLLGGAASTESQSAPAVNPLAGLLGGGDAGFDAGLVKTLTGVGKIMATSDPRCDFLLALKPLLSERHRERADHAVKMLKLMKALPILKENGILKGLL